MCRPSESQAITSQTTHLFTAVNKMEMLEIIPVTYTSLRDLMSAAQHQQDVAPTFSYQKGSDHDISIRNPLVKQAALAYLSPRSTPPDNKRHCLGDCCSCVDFLNNVVLDCLKKVFGYNRRAVGFEGYDGFVRHGKSHHGLMMGNKKVLSSSLENGNSGFY